ncbi:hypothetical protein V8E51_004828 [Hyaloscypha variabilis]
MERSRLCDLYNFPEETCECDAICGTRHESCSEHSKGTLGLPEDFSSRVSMEENNYEKGSSSGNSKPPPTLSREPSPLTAFLNEHDYYARELLEKNDRYKEFMSICLALSTSNFTSALKCYHGAICEHGFTYRDEKVLREFRKVIKLVNPRKPLGEVDFYQMADIMAGDSFTDGSTTTGRTYIAARKYRMLVQWYGGRFEVYEDIERLISSVLRLNKHFKIHPEAFGSDI